MTKRKQGKNEKMKNLGGNKRFISIKKVYISIKII